MRMFSFFRDLTSHRSLLLFCFAWLVCAFPARAQVSAAASFDPPTARVGQSVEFRVVIMGGRVADLPNLAPPDGLDFVPNGSSVSIVELNGRPVTKSVLSYIVISRFQGEFPVPAFEVDINGQNVRVPPVRLVVSEGNARDAGEPTRVVLDVPKRDYYVGESIHARLLFIASADEMPTYVQQITKTSGNVLFKPARNYLTRPGQFNYDGKTVSGLNMAVEIIPLGEGDIPVNCEAAVQVQRLDGFTPRRGLGGLGGPSTFQSPTTNLHVVALPRVDRPAGFTGAIGQFSVAQPKLSATEAEVGEPITVAFSVTGEGNIDAVPAPALGEDSQWRTYKPTSEFAREEESGKGMKTFTYTIIAKQAGKRSTPPIPFAYFDPVKRGYVDLTIPPLTVNVKAAPGAPAAAANAEAAAADVPSSLPPREVEPILTGLAETSGGWTRHLGPNFRFFFYAQLVAPALLLLAWLWRRRREYLAAHPEIPLRRRSRAAARRALAEARSAARKNDVPGFLRAGTGALCEAAARYHGAGAASMTPSEVLHHLEGEAALAARTIFEHADAVRYASSANEPPRPASLLSGLERAVSVLTAQA